MGGSVLKKDLSRLIIKNKNDGYRHQKDCLMSYPKIGINTKAIDPDALCKHLPKEVP